MANPKLFGRRVRPTKRPKGTRLWKVRGAGKVKGLYISPRGEVKAMQVARASNPKPARKRRAPKKRRRTTARKSTNRKRTSVPKRRRRTNVRRMIPGSAAWVKKMADARKRAAGRKRTAKRRKR